MIYPSFIPFAGSKLMVAIRHFWKSTVQLHPFQPLYYQPWTKASLGFLIHGCQTPTYAQKRTSNRNFWVILGIFIKSTGAKSKVLEFNLAKMHVLLSKGAMASMLTAHLHWIISDLAKLTASFYFSDVLHFRTWRVIPNWLTLPCMMGTGAQG